jgi:hypothetical protein
VFFWLKVFMSILTNQPHQLQKERKGCGKNFENIIHFCMPQS